MKTQRIFTDIFHNGIWRKLDPHRESHSGVGSTLEATKAIRGFLPNLLEEIDCKTVLDVPCGDFNWMRYVDFENRLYIGIDIVQELIDTNQQNYSTPQRSFHCLDLLVDDLPQSDLVICRDCLVHLSFDNAWLAIENIRRSKSKYLLTTTYTERIVNKPISTGQWTAYSLLISPFDFPEPISLLNENCMEIYPNFIDKSVGLWKIEDLPKSI